MQSHGLLTQPTNTVHVGEQVHGPLGQLHLTHQRQVPPLLPITQKQILQKRLPIILPPLQITSAIPRLLHLRRPNPPIRTENPRLQLYLSRAG